MYSFGEADTVEDLLTRPGMAARLLEHRERQWDDEASYWGSPAGKMLHARCRGLLTPPSKKAGGEVLLSDGLPQELAVPFTFGADGAQLFDTKQHGSLVCGLKLLGLLPEDASKNEYWAPYLVVNGPTEPQTLQFILAPLLRFFVDHDPGATFLRGEGAPV